MTDHFIKAYFDHCALAINYLLQVSYKFMGGVWKLILVL